MPKSENLPDDSYTPREKGLQRRNKILDAAEASFIENGYEATSLQEIMSKAGGSLATLYRMFGNKEGLFKAIIERATENLSDSLLPLDADNPEPEKVLNALGIAFINVLTSPYVGAIHRLLISESARYPQLREIFMQTAPERNLRRVEDYLRKLNQRGYLEINDCKIAAEQLVSLFKGTMHLRSVLGEEVILSEDEKAHYVESAVSMFLNGCRSDK
ncbi:TetR/AcrR family transcriptional regulator [Alteromonas confluentis]|uniref:TetR family transcriptional regulator n=1 Tax=Alteromonas confluentis TaxID=1656094 RepID=A0A1E7Z789_9ALTE|nr:TetR/AcrR family transcriptional regulator [Alteromonas confluentis]OFC69380.1 TetR family transcriptional regulator [Alteromonas confluentis]